jgi:predicted NUDIX family NTP pyrophosphohydrolase
MSKRISGGLLLYKITDDSPRLLVAHPGGPFFRKRDEGWWSIPKGEPEEGEDIFEAAIREFEEETGLCPEGPYLELGDILQKNGKRVYAWGFEGEWEDGRIPECNEITLEFPKGTGKKWTFPEIDQAELLSLEDAKRKLRVEQHPFVDRLIAILNEKENCS